MRAIPSLIVLSVVMGSSPLVAQNPTNAAAAVAAAAAVTVAGATVSATGTTANPVQVVAPPVTTPVPRLEPAGTLRLTNLSTRARVTPESPLITGFAIRGTAPRTMLVRAAGPALAAFGVPDTVATPRLRLHDSAGAVIAENAGWSTAPLASAATAVAGAFPFGQGSADSAVVATLAPGNYSAEVIADGGPGGVALVEVYDVGGTAAGSSLANVSTLGTVAPNGGEVISGFVIAGTGTRQYLIRGVGPGLGKVGVTGVLKDPIVTVFNSAGQQVAGNDDWSGNTKTYVAAVAAAVSGTGVVAPTATPSWVMEATQLTGAFALDLNSADAALVITLAPGAYTVKLNGLGTPVTTVVSGAATAAGAIQAVQIASVGTAPPAPGVALLEIYELP